MSKILERDEVLSRLRLMPLAKRARAVTGLTQTAFCDRYGIPLPCQRDWEQGRSDPPEASTSYLTVILHDTVADAPHPPTSSTGKRPSA